MEKINETISIGLPVYNGEKYLDEAIYSLLSQSYRNIEIIISDNASTDKTEEICRNYARNDNRIKYVRLSENIGAISNFKHVLRLANGKYFMWHAADDTRSSDCIANYIANIDDVGGIFSTYAKKDRLGKTLEVRNVPILNGSRKNKEQLKSFFKTNCTAIIYGLFVREYLLKCMPEDCFDWWDSYVIVNILYKYGIKTYNDNPQFFYGFDGAYIAKPLNGKKIKSWQYFFKVLIYAVYAGPVALIYHTNTLRISAILNSKMNK
jgi:glycosyltransferase involved in cell wall biosynthesis